MYNKLILSSFLCGLLSATGMVFGMENPLNNEHQLLVVFHNESQQNEWKCYDLEGKEVNKNFNTKAIDLSRHTLQYDDINNQKIYSKKETLSLDENKLSEYQIMLLNQKLEQTPFQRKTKDKARAFIAIGDQLKRIFGTHEMCTLTSEKDFNDLSSSSQENTNEPQDCLNLNSSETTSEDPTTILPFCALLNAVQERNVETELKDLNATNPTTKENITDTTENNDNTKKPSSGYTKRHYFVGGISAGFLVGLGIYLLSPEKMTQLFQSLCDKAVHLLQPLKSFSLSHLKRN